MGAGDLRSTLSSLLPREARFQNLSSYENNEFHHFTTHHSTSINFDVRSTLAAPGTRIWACRTETEGPQHPSLSGSTLHTHPLGPGSKQWQRDSIHEFLQRKARVTPESHERETPPMSENKARQLRGELYYAFTPEMVNGRRRCTEAFQRFNNSGEVSRRKRVELWRE